MSRLFVTTCLIFTLFVCAPVTGVFGDVWDAPTFSLYSSAVEAYNQGDYKKARGLLEESIKDYPDNLLSLYLLGNTLIQLKEDDKALPVLEKTVRIYPRLPDAWAAMGAIHERKNDSSEAIACYQKVAEQDPKNPEWPQRMAVIALKAKDKKGAETYLKQWIGLEPEDLDAVILLADLLSEQNRWEEAAQVLETHYPKNGNALMATRLAGGYFNRGKFEKASVWFEKLRKLEPESADHPYRLGFIAYKAGDKAKAEDFFAQALAMDPNNFGAAYNLGVLRMEQKKYEEAVKLFKRCTKIRPKAKEPYLQLGAIYEKVLLDPAKAEEYYQKGGGKPKS